FGSKADICSAKRHVRFTPNSDIDCFFRHVCFGPRADMAGRATYLPASQRPFPPPLRARGLKPLQIFTKSRNYPSAIRRSRCLSGMVRRIGLMLTSFKDSNSSLVSGTNVRLDMLGNRDRIRAMPSMLL